MVLIDPVSSTITRTIKGDHLFMDAGFGSVWITTRDNRLERFDPVTAEITASIPVGIGIDDCMNDVEVKAPAVWVISCDTAELIKVDPISNSVVSRASWASLITEAQAQAYPPSGKGTDSVWMTMLGDEGGGDLPSGLLGVSPITGSGVAFVPLTPEQVGDASFAVADDAVWLGGSGEISRVDVATNQVDVTFPTAPGRLKVAIGYGSVWMRNFEQDLVQRLDVEP